jgi:hypothetical protein
VKSIINIIREEIEQFDWGKEKVAAESIKPNRIVYHISEPKNRTSIAQNGLIPQVGKSYSDWTNTKKSIPAIFATNSDINNVTGGVPKFGADIWAIDTTKINNQWFVDKHFQSLKDYGFNNPHIVTFEKIPKEAIFLAHKANESIREEIENVSSGTYLYKMSGWRCK